MKDPRTLNQTNRKRRLPAAMRPTLVIGLGGTGHRIVVHLKACLVQAYGRVPADRLRLLAFDTADEIVTVSVDGEPLSLERDRELFQVGHTPVPNIVRNIERQPAIAERLPAIQAIPAVALRTGAKQIRPLGLLALLWRSEEIERRITDAIWDLADKENLGRRAGSTQGINVFICNSLVGGTGSGMFLDVAYLVRAIFSELGSMSDFCYVTGVGVLPQAFRGIDGPNLVPNTVAALKELGHCMQNGDFACQYPNGRWLSSPYPPFNLYYLIDGVDEQGYTWHGLNALCAMVAAGLFLQIGSQLGRKGENDFDNLDGVLAQATEEGDGTFFGSFGIASLYFPGRGVASWCTDQLARAMVEQSLLRPPNDDGEEASKAWLKAQALDVPTLLRELAQDDEGVPFAVDLRLSPHLRRARDVAGIQEVIGHVHDYRRLRIDGDFRVWAKANGAALEERWGDGLEHALAAALTHPERGLTGALTLASALDRHLSGMEKDLEARHTTAEAERGRVEIELQEQAEALRQAGSGTALFRGRAIAAARGRYIEVAEHYLEQILARSLAESALALVARLRRRLASYVQALETLRSRLSAARRMLQEEEERLLHEVQRETIGRICLADTSYCRALYRRHAPSPQEAVAELLHDASPLAWTDLDVDTLLEELRREARRYFRPVAAMTVEDVLRERASEISPQAYQARLFRLAAPSWNLDTTRLQDGGAGLRTIRVLGVPDEGSTVFVEDAPSLVSTHDPTTVNAFLATIGAPCRALQQYDDYERRYQDTQRIRPLHVLPQFQVEDEQARLAFALGAVFNMIFSRGFYYYYRPEDPLDSPLKLGNGLSNAIGHFARADTLVQEVMTRVERNIEEIGTVQALAILTDYYSREDGEDDVANSKVDELVADLRKRVRTYADELRQTQRVTGAE